MSEESRKPSAEKFEQAAANLDRGCPALGEADTVARQLRHDLAWLDGQLDVHVDDAMLLRVNARLAAALGRPQRRWRRLFIPAAAAAAVALAVIWVTVVASRPAPQAAPQAVAAAETDPDTINRDAQAALASLDDDMFRLVARLATAQPADLELQFSTGDTSDEDDAQASTDSLPVW